MNITGFKCWIIEESPWPPFAWRDGLPGSHGEYPGKPVARNAVVRMDTDTGAFGAVKLRGGDAALDLISRRFHHFIGENPLNTERMWNLAWEIDRIEEINIKLLGLLDTLCWDVKSKVASLPIYQLLGGHDPVVPVYASTVTWPTVADYERNIKLCMDQGFTAFKLHAWGDVRRDIELSRALRSWTGPDADLMFDGSAGWDYVDALKVGVALQDEGFLWYEEPMREFHLGSYTKLCEKLTIPVLAAETSDGAHWNMASWIEAGALDMTRVSSNFKGGFTGSMKIAHMAESFGMRAQVHGMGLENAQICAAISNNDYYEQLVMSPGQITELKDLGPLSVIDGMLNVSDAPGIGYDIDWDYVEAHAVAVVESRIRHF